MRTLNFHFFCKLTYGVISILECLTHLHFLQINHHLKEYCRCFFKWNHSRSFMPCCTNFTCTLYWFLGFSLQWNLLCLALLLCPNFKHRLPMNGLFPFFSSTDHFQNVLWDLYLFAVRVDGLYSTKRHQIGVCFHILRTPECFWKSLWPSLYWQYVLKPNAYDVWLGCQG